MRRNGLPAIVLLAVLAVPMAIWLVLPAAPVLPTPVAHVERLDADGHWQPAQLPDELAPADGGVARASYRWHAPAAQAFYAPGLIAHARLTLNDRVLVDDLGPPDVTPPPRPRGAQALRWLDLPPEVQQADDNAYRLDVAAPRWLGVSPILLGDRIPLRAAFERKLAALVTGPQVVAALIGVLGLFTLALWARRPLERQYGYFGLGAVFWSLHTLWTGAPRAGLGGVHYGVWWNTLYAAVVIMLVLFALRFAQRRWKGVERTLLIALAAVPVLLYGAVVLGLFGPASDALRLSLVLLAFGGLAVVAEHAWFRRSIPSALFVLAGAASAGLGLRDWIVYRYGADNFPVPLTPYAGGPFVLLVGWLLLDRFVRTAQSLEAVNRGLEQRVAQREAQLAENFERLAAAERERAAVAERQRLLRELHDGVGARLVHLKQRVSEGELDIARLGRELQEGLADMRLASETLAPDNADFGLAVSNFLFRWEPLLRDAGTQPHWQVDLSDGASALPAYAQLQLLRILQDGMSNVLRHAEASQVVLRIAAKDGQLQFELEDDGRGMEPSARGRGIHAMCARAQALGGECRFETPPGGGTRLRLALPHPRDHWPAPPLTP
jgi:signal transduction histidine kinase